MGDLKEHHGKLGKIAILPNFLVDEPYLAVEVVMEPRVFSSGKDREYEVVVGFSEAHVVMNHPGYEANAHYAATVAPDIWKASVNNKTSLDASGTAEVSTGFSLFGFLTGNAGAKAAAQKARVAEVNEAVPYPLIQPTIDGWAIGGIHGDPRYGKNNVGEKAGLLQGSYFKGDIGEDSAAEKTPAGRPKSAKLQYRDGANSLKITATLSAPKSALQVRVRRLEGNAITAVELAQDHADQLKEALIKLCVARELEMTAASGGGLATPLGNDQVFLDRNDDRNEKLGQKPAKAKR